MQSKKLAGAKPSVSTQRYLDIAEIRDGVVVLKDGTLRVALLISSINFALKSEEEQEAVISAYVSFLNSINFPLQIVIQSRKLNIDDYLARLEKSEKEQTNDLLKIQIADYKNFISELVELGDIMSKRFFVIVPHNPLTDKRKGFFERVKEVLVPAVTIRLKEERFKSKKNALMMRVNHVVTGLQSMGVNAIPLDTQSLIELYYEMYNPDIRKSQKVKEVGKLRIEE
ncbi:MAG: hypothetical protein U9P90_01315 [Patescibacteria group bacterium]|nr:hypothetical protein [Patescibacteria group bacterium]